ncbi:MAG: TRAP transporter substrate-binding protein [Deltaproteobacteria bacterium]|nr:TRAP transporter substrate-binding protein [Deltaproteobacteria bacterium]
MNRKVFSLLMVVFFGFAFVTLGAGHVQAKTIQLTYANFFPPTHFNGKLGESWAKEIETRTKGQVKITYFPGGALLKGPEICDGVMKGVSDIGMSCFAYTRGRFPAMEALDLPIGYTSGYAATMVANDFYNKFKPVELDEVKVLYIHAHGPGLLHSKKAVKTLEDMKGLKVRATGFSSKVATALGAAPVGMPQGGTYEALQKGVVEATFGPIEVLKGWKQGEVIKYTTECFGVGYTTAMYVTMNKKKWASLPEDVKKVFEAVSNEWIAKHADGWDAADEEGKKFSLSLGNEMIPLSAEEDARWAEAVKPVLDEYVKAATDKGLPGADYVTFIKETIKKHKK